MLTLIYSGFAIGFWILLILHVKYLKTFLLFDPFKMHPIVLEMIMFLLFFATDFFKVHFDNVIIETSFAIVSFFTCSISLFPYFDPLISMAMSLAISWTWHHSRHWILSNLILFSFVSLCSTMFNRNPSRRFLIVSFAMHFLMYMIHSNHYYINYKQVPMALWIPNGRGGYDTRITWYTLLLPLLFSSQGYYGILHGSIAISLYFGTTTLLPPIMYVYLWMIPSVISDAIRVKRNEGYGLFGWRVCI
jgi:hypothetical protein